MDIKCKNCGQMIDEKDKYCKYCGYLIPQKEEEIPLSKLAIDDKIQQEKATIHENEIVDSTLWSMTDLSVKMIGNKNSIYSKSVMYTVLLILLGVAFFVGAFLAKFLIANELAALICLLVFMFAMLVTFAFALERFYNSKGLKDLKEGEVTVRKYGFKKPAEVLIKGNVFEIVIDKSCPVCEGEIIGDLHIERIESKLVVVCNINRKHIFRIDDIAFIQALTQGEINIVKTKNKEKK